MRSGARAMACVAAGVLLVTGATVRGAEPQRYSLPRSVDVTLLLSPPQTASTAADRDLEAVHAAQRARTTDQAADAEDSSVVDVFRFRTVLGPAFTPERLPRTGAFFGRVMLTALPWLQVTKDCWARPRPFVVDPTLAPLERSLASTRVAPQARPVAPRAAPAPGSPCVADGPDPTLSPSYPSGHAAVGAIHAILLARMVPERRAALFERGWANGEARVIGGVHFPSDVEAGRILGTVLVGLLEQDARFRADLRAARSELRAALGFP